jgi:uncharacterized membrane protein YesL
MREFFGFEGPFYKYGGMLADILILSLMWIFFSIPIVTIGASTTALFYVTTRRIAEREGYVTKDFVEAFKSNFKKATIIWLIMAAVISLLGIYIALFLFAFEFLHESIGEMAIIMFPIWVIFLVEAVFISIYIYPLLARFDMGIKQLFKSAFYMSIRHFLTTVTCVILGAGIFIGMFWYPLLMVVAMGLYAWLSSYMIMRLFKKYRPEMDKDPMLELQELELERKNKKKVYTTKK